MSDRTCPHCGASADTKLKFCRECGGRIEDGPAPSLASIEGSGDETIVASSPRRPSPAAGARAPEEADKTMVAGAAARPPAADARIPEEADKTMVAGATARPPAGAPPDDLPGGTGTKSFVGAFPPPSSEEEEPEESDAPPGGDRTIMAGAVRPKAPPAPPPPPDGEGGPSVTATFVGTVPPPLPPVPAPSPPPRAPSPAPVPPSSAGPEIEEIEPVSDDLDLGDDDSGATLAAAAPPPRPQPAKAPPPPPPAPAPTRPSGGTPSAAGIRLEHWSPKVKSESVAMEKPETVVGRDRGDVKYPDDNYLSKKHARFFRDAQGRFSVEDLGSLNGTFLRLRAPFKLEHRDTLFLGRHAFRFELLQYEEQDDRTIEGDPLTRVQGVQGAAPRARIVKRQEEGFRGVPFFFGTAKYVLGRTDGTHNFQKDDLMSRRHASITYRDGDYWIEDLGSQNGSFVRLRGPHSLETGDVVKMGDQYFKLA